MTPCYVAFTADGDILVGEDAKNQLTVDPKNVMFDVKRLIGRTWDDVGVQAGINRYPYKMVNRDGKPKIEVSVQGKSKVFTPKEITTMVIGKMKATAEAYLGENVTHAVVTVPTYYGETQRAAIKEAACLSESTVMRVVDEPKVSSIAYGLDTMDPGEEKRILVFDLGGGTFDVSFLSVENGVFEIVSINKEPHLGGNNFDQRVTDHFLKIFKANYNKDLGEDARTVQKLRHEVEKAKRELSSLNQTTIEIESMPNGMDFSETLTRAQFEELNLAFFQSTLSSIQQVLEDADMKTSDIDEVVLVGGSARIPKIQQLVRDFVNGKAPCQGIDPDEAVVHGAALTAGVLGGAMVVTDLVVFESNMLSVGIETVGGFMQKFINRNRLLPAKISRNFSTATDNQTDVIIRLFEGERPLTKDNHLLGTLNLTGILGAPRGVLQVEITLGVDVAGNINVSAEDIATGNQQQITISYQNRLHDPEDYEQIFREVEQFAEDDARLMTGVELQSELESMADWPQSVADEIPRERDIFRDEL